MLFKCLLNFIVKKKMSIIIIFGTTHKASSVKKFNF
jgi:hypothetical protein